MPANVLDRFVPEIADDATRRESSRVVVADDRTDQGSVLAARECLRTLDRIYALLA